MRREYLSLGIAIVMILLATVALALMASKAEKVEHRLPVEVTRSVLVDTVHYADAHPGLAAMGRIRSMQPVDLSAEVTAKILPQRFSLRTGTNFRKGQVLLQLDDTRALLVAKGLSAELMNALAQVLPDLKTDFPERYELWSNFFHELDFGKLPKLPEVKNDREKLFLSRFRIFNLYWNLASQIDLVNRHMLLAPFAGSVATGMVRPGDLARVGSSLARLVRTDCYELELPLRSKDATRIHLGAVVDVRLAGEETLTGKVSRLDRVLGENTQTRSVWVTLDAKKGLWLEDGSFAEANIRTTGLHKVWPLPRAALRNENAVWLVQEGRLALGKVKIAWQAPDTVWVAAGPEEGTVVVTQSLPEAFVGQRVLLSGEKTE